MIQTSNPESKDFIKDLSNESVVDLSNKISFDQEKFKSPEDISKKDKLLASLQDIIEAKTDASALNSDLEHIFEVFLNSAAISTLPQNPTFGEILAAFDTWKCPANVALNYAAVDIKNYVCDLLELNDQKQQEIIKVVADAKNSEKTVEKKVLSRTENLLQTKIDANNQKIAELENLIINHKSTIQATIEREEAKGKTFTQKQIDDYKKSLEPTLEGRKKELQNLKAENVQLSADLHNAEFLENDEAHVQQYLSQLETATDDTTTKAELVGHQNAGADYANIKNKTKKDSKALKWMRDGKGGIDPVGENLSKEDQKDLKNLSTIVNRIDLQHAVDFMDKYRNLTSSQATKEQWTQKIKENFSKDYAMKNRGLNALFHSQEKAVYEFANYYFDYHKGNASQTPVNQFMLQLLSGARAEMSVVDIYNNKRLIDVVVDGLTKDKTTAEKQGEQSQKNEWLSSSEEALVRLLGDTNMDGRVVGVAGQKQTKKEQLDASNIFGTQIMSAYNAAKVELSIQNSDPKIVDQILIKNLFSLILNNPDKIYRHNQELNFKNFLKQKGFTSDGNGGYNVPESIQNFDDVLQFFSKDPALFNVLKKSVNGSHEYLVQAFTYGAKYADHHLQREKDVR
ncbi:MAG: hypothetical protein LBD11_04630 [Candidatus Peribacteria bacterium]|nr:hypothetical protein [Candidatus Peribacteria bacterium]